MREHILHYDEPPLDWSPALASTIDREMFGNVVTRAIGRTSSNPPEVAVWPVEGPYTVILCASDAYQGRDYHGQMGAYLEALCNGALIDPGDGITRIEYVA